MDMYLKGQTALVTGSTKGIGKAIAFELAKEGVDVIVNGRSTGTVNEVVAEIKTAYPMTNPSAAPFDITTQEGTKQMTDAFPKVDILVNNLGIFTNSDYFQLTDADWQHYFDVNVLSGNRLASYYLPQMLERDAGRILFIASEVAVMPDAEMPQYSMSKTMQLSLSKTLAKLTQGSKVTVNTVMPGSTMTEGVVEMLENWFPGGNETLVEKGQRFMKENRPNSLIQKFIAPEEIGRMVVFVSSPMASAINGAALRVDGGLVPTLY
ncbi:MAG: SDR family oxidoreductase [Carnobacterium sp.]|uniref:SDR family NAD(P)-dependent oxidoreductase n=1 Tax=Carnobacterium TaxID=2747 RepID=UPI0010716D09|nr:MULTISPECIES: SDR family oxidoreductase [Carnobacterium]MBQ6483400.1 SDR family oxidoreductase [Carnobacterium sp.]MDT1945143.1 SDR family oxidoreductase [Carnobacterium maltaromaticum]MDT1999514.1 SDR family oxidoreductase [Carnobacterium maltaromaticum]TFJ32139.1 oxidoreductase [Carnobacterium maltaromaticum]TFJ35490.1 oxidoreductase [Carnobacterium maltaromaticum]